MNKETLNNISLGKTVTVSKLNCNSITKRRLLDLGIINSTKITPVLKSSIGNLIAYEIRNNIIALRAEDTCLIEVIS